MLHLRRARCVLLLSFAGPVAFTQLDCLAQSQLRLAVVSGTVYDPSGARIPQATVSVYSDSLTREMPTDGEGRFSFSLPLGSYQLSIAAKGFSLYTGTVSLTSSASAVHLELPLSIASRKEEIAVPMEDLSSTSGADNASSLVFQGVDLSTFSNDDATFQKELLALAGGSSTSSAEIFVDGFSTGRLPPKSSILSIRLNRNRYSALYDRPGTGRIEIYTKPGTDTFHGQFNINATDSPFNSLNPYIVGTAPPYYILNLDGNVSGPIDRKTSFLLSGVFNDLQNNAALNAVTVVNGQQTPYAQAIRDPQRISTFALRVDRQLTPDNSFTSRYEWNQVNLTNGGLNAPLTLATQAFNSGMTTQTLRFIDTQVVNAHLVSEAHFQYIRSRQQQDASSSAPTLLVEGAFNGGGNPAQALRDNQDRFEFQQQLSIDQGAHYLRFGARYRLLREASLSRANYNGSYIFPSLAAYIANAPSLYTGTVGQPSFALLTGDLGAYAEDEWRVTKSITLDLGFRVESQSSIPDHLDMTPRFGAAWALHRKNQRAAFLTLRTGGGLFYDRFDAANILTTVRQNGVSQQTFQLANPCFNPNGSPAAAPCGQPLTATPPTPYRVSPNFKAQSAWIGGFGVEKVFGRFGTASVNYEAVRGVHQTESLNVNAPLPGTYNPAVPGSGVRPLGGAQNIYQFGSGGIEKEQIFFFNSRLNLGKYANVYVTYNIVHTRQNVGGATVFASNSYDLSQDYGRAAQPTNRLFTGGTLHLPFGADLNLFASASGGIPFNITTGTDLNGDTIYNDRPAFATRPTANSVVYRTRYGSFDANPQPGEEIIPINYGNSPNFLYLDLSANRTFKFGPRPSVKAVATAASPAARPDPPFAVTFTVDSPNFTNHRNPDQPIGVLNSPLFGQSISLSNPFNATTAANRVLFLQVQFGF